MKSSQQSFEKADLLLEDPTEPLDKNDQLSVLQWIGLVLGPVIFVVMLLVPAPEGLTEAGWRTASIGLLMAIWWLTEAIPIPVTALIPLILFPLVNVVPMEEAAGPYANPLIFLFMGGFIIALGMQTWNLHRRIALRIVSFVGVKPSSIVIGFMIASAFLSMWVSNTATALMMLPIGLSIITLARDRPGFEQKESLRNFSIVLVLSIAYACNIGGMGTIIGTPPNALLVGFMSETYDFEIGFGQWMMMGVPLVIFSLPIAYLILTRISFPLKLTELPGGSSIINSELANLGPMTNPETKVSIVFILTAALWITRPLISDLVPGITDAGIAMAAAFSMFLIPVDLKKGAFLLSWKQAQALPWGILILFGGGLSLANAITLTGLSEWIGEGVGGLAGWPTVLLIFAVVGLVIMLTELTSNTATAATFLPILASVAIGAGQSPLYFVIPAALAASCAFMMPVATPPNAIVYSSDLFTIPQMAKTGMWLNFIFVFILTLFSYLALIFVFGFA